MWKPKEIIVHEAITDDPATLYFIDKCPDIPVKYVADSKSKTIKEASTVLKNSGDSMLEQIQAGKQVVFIAPATKQVDEFQIEDRRILCPCFPRLKLAFNGCYYNCDWCYLKLTYRAQRPYITIKVQYDTIKKQLQEEIEKRPGPVMFNSGELGDSLALDHLTGANKEFIPWFGQTDNAYLFMLSKSDNVDEILDLPHNNHTILTWSINNENVARKFEIAAPTIERRLNAAAKVQEAGYPVRIRLDPVIPIDNWKSAYAETVKQIFDKVSPESITIGTLRFEPGFYGQRKTIFSTGAELESHVETMNPMFEPKLYPGDKKPRVGKYSFPEEQRIEIFQHIMEEIKKYSDCPIALCKETSSVWKATGLDTSQCSCVCQFEPADMSKVEREIQEDSSMEIETKPEIRDGIEFINGSTKILLVAPHGVETKPYDDEQTAVLTREIQRHLKCHTIVNPTFRKPDATKESKRNGGVPDLENWYLDLNKIEQAEQHPTFIPKIKEIVDKNDSTYVFWIHGIDDENIKEGIDCYVGCGQPNNKGIGKKGKEARYTATQKNIDGFLTQLNNVGIKTALAPEDSKYRGWSQDYMNQWFRIEDYTLEKAQSIQLEFKYTGIREKDCIQSAGIKIAKAISNLLSVPFLPMDDVDDEKVEKAYEHLKEIFVKHFQNAMLECGQYLIKTFYDDNYELAHEKKFTRDKSLSMLIKRIQKDSTEKGDVPSRTWLYDAVNLAIDDYLFEQKQLPSVYGQLGHSHKVNLTSAPIEVKPALVQEAFDKEYTVAELRDRIREEKDKLNPDRVSLKETMSIKKLGTLEPKQLKALKVKTEGLVKKVQDEVKLYQGNLALIEQALNKK